jgi:hypothetical protein
VADELDWRARRAHAVSAHAEAENRRRAADTARAWDLVARFVAEATAKGLPTVPLTALAYNGRTRYRTGLRGWYLKPDRSIAVTPDGEFYVLSVPASLRARFAGATVQPADPPLVIGVGARDGESVALDALLRLVLDAGEAGTQPPIR